MTPITFEAQVIQSKRHIQRRITLPKAACDEWDIQPFDVLRVTVEKVLPKDKILSMELLNK
jgi:hypothetical protein